MIYISAVHTRLWLMRHPGVRKALRGLWHAFCFVGTFVFMAWVLTAWWV